MKTLSTLFAVVLAVLVSVSPARAEARWSTAQAKTWWDAQPFRAGCNYIPSNAINPLEMWQADTFSPEIIDRELGWTEGVGFNCARVFLHNLAWRQDPEGFLKRMDTFLGIADKHHVAVLFVFFDSVWDPEPKAGKQPAPRPGLHNSGWVQSPGRELLIDGSKHGELEAYVKQVLQRFGKDRRLWGWDLFNEPDNDNASSYGAKETPYKSEYALILLKEVFAWAKAVNPDQPLTTGVWKDDWSEGKLNAVNRFMLENSDIISFHTYDKPDELRRRIAVLKRYDRPMICTEYMARPRGSRFETHLPIFQEAKVGAMCWGMIAGKSQTIYPWDSWQKPYPAEPPEWFHDVLRSDGTPYKPDEVAFLRKTLLPAKS
jgi:hypothetical protein